MRDRVERRLVTRGDCRHEQVLRAPRVLVATELGRRAERDGRTLAGDEDAGVDLDFVRERKGCHDPFSSNLSATRKICIDAKEARSA